MPGTKGFRYVYAQSQIGNILHKIASTRRPDKLTFPYLRDTWLLRNKQYLELIPLLRDMGFLDSSNVPTELYARYQNHTRAKKVLAEGVRNAYPELFRAFPDPQSLPKEELEGYIRQHTGAATAVTDKVARTFRTICSLADLSGTTLGKEADPTPAEEAPEPPKGHTVDPNVQLNLQIHISPDMTEEKIEALFRSMRRHLLTR